MTGQTLRAFRESKWTFKTSGTGGLAVGYFAAVGGEQVLVDPAGNLKGFYYGAAGVGIGVGVKRIPKIGRIVDSRGLSERGSANLAPKPFWNHGVVYIMDGFHGVELTAEDFRGVCVSIDVGGGVIVGYAGTALLINVNPLALVTETSPLLSFVGPSLSPKAMILSRGWNVGPQASVGASGTIGYLWPKGGRP